MGVSTQALNPSYVPGSSLTASRRALASLPFGGRSGSAPFPDGPLGRRAARERREALLADARDAHEHRHDGGGPATGDARVPRRERQQRDHEQATVSLSPAGSHLLRGRPRGGCFGILPGQNTYGTIRIQTTKNNDGTCGRRAGPDVDVQTETYTVDPVQGVGDFKTGMEGYAYFHGYSSFQSNLGTMSFDGAESSSAYRTNLILSEVGGDYCDVVIAAYLPGSFVPIASVGKRIPPMGYLSDELFHNILGLESLGAHRRARRRAAGGRRRRLPRLRLEDRPRVGRPGQHLPASGGGRHGTVTGWPAPSSASPITAS